MRNADPAIIAIGGSDHDVNACIVRGDRVLVAIEEERISRRKYGLGGDLMAGLARRYCLDFTGLKLSEIDHVVVDSILVPTALLPYRKRAVKVDHHLAHAAASFFTSGFPSAAVLVVDNGGDLISEAGCQRLQTTSWYHAKGRSIDRFGGVGSTNWKCGRLVRGEPYQRGDGDHSLGHFYKKVTGALGFRFPKDAPLEGFYFPEDGITMGLASYGDARFFDTVWKHVELLPDGGYRVVLNDGAIDLMLGQMLGESPDFATKAAVAGAFQEALTRVICHMVEYVLRHTGETALCLGGGVAMNSVCNGEILRRTSVQRLYIPPIPGDNGTAVGAALWTATRFPDSAIPAYTVYGGRPWAPADLDDALLALDRTRYAVLTDCDCDIIDEAADRLAAGQILGWFQGGSENGRRALGNRSILSDPREQEAREHLNRDIKRREPFRPFAPVVALERAGEFFEMEQPSPYMQIVFPVRRQWREKLAATTHVDGSARVQTISGSQSPRLHELLLRFEKTAGVPVLLNTSLNGPGEPIVETPGEALQALNGLRLDGMVFEDRMVVRR